MGTDKSNLVTAIDTAETPGKDCKYGSANTVESNFIPKTSLGAQHTRTVRSSLTHGSISIRTIPAARKRSSADESTT